MTEELDALIQGMSGACGQDLTRYDPAFLAQSLERRLAATGGGSAAAYLARLAEDRGEAAAFYRGLSISHSEFFRTPLTFALLETLVLPAIAAERTRTGRPEVRVWSAGCAGGQEPYSLAILLAELAAPHRIFASDIAEAELAAAQQGVYGEARCAMSRCAICAAVSSRAASGSPSCPTCATRWISRVTTCSTRARPARRPASSATSISSFAAMCSSITGPTCAG